MLDFGFDVQGGFYVIDHERRRAAYAYPTSTHAEAAKKTPDHVADEMTASLYCTASPAIHESMYQSVCRSARKATLNEKIERAVREYNNWSPAERRRLSDIIEEVKAHCRDGNGNQFIREWTNRILVPKLRPLFS